MANFIPYGTYLSLDEKLNSDEIGIRLPVAEMGYGLDFLIYDTDWIIRRAVAEQGYGLDILYKDTNKKVRKATNEYLKENNYTDINDWIAKNPDRCVS